MIEIALTPFDSGSRCKSHSSRRSKRLDGATGHVCGRGLWTTSLLMGSECAGLVTSAKWAG
jgi:hypothetical protein